MTHKLLQKQLLISGYSRIFVCVHIPNDVLSLCLDMYGLDDFIFTVKKSDLTQLISKEILFQEEQRKHTRHDHQTDTGPWSWGNPNINNTSNARDDDEKKAATPKPDPPSCDSQIFEGKEIKYQLLMMADTSSSSDNFHWSSDNNSMPPKSPSSLQLHIKIIDPFSDSENENTHKIAKVILFCVVRCKQMQNMEMTCIINSGYKFKDKKEIIKYMNFTEIRLKDLSTFDEFEFIGTIDVMHLEVMDNTLNKLFIYHENVKLNKYTRYKWKLNNQLKSSHLDGAHGRLSYSSKPFGNNCWRVSFSFNKNIKDRNFYMVLYLMKIPINIEKIRIFCRSELKYKNTSYVNGSSDLMSHSTSSGGDGCYSTVVTIPYNERTFENEPEKLNLDLIEISVYIEIFRVYKQNYYKIIMPELDTNRSSDWNYGGWSGHNTKDDKYLVCKEQFGLYGITKNYEAKSEEINKLFLQKEILLKFNDKDMDEDKHNEEIKYDENDDENEMDNLSDSVDDIKYDESESEDENDEIIKEIRQKNETKKRDKNPFEWIEKTLKQLETKHYDQILAIFKENEINDSRLHCLEDANWNKLIPQIGVRNEMRNIWKNKNSKISKTIRQSNENKKEKTINRDLIVLVVAISIITQMILFVFQYFYTQSLDEETLVF